MKAILPFSALLILSYSCNNSASKTDNAKPIDTNSNKIVDTVLVPTDPITQILPPPTTQEFMVPKIDPIDVDIEDAQPPMINQRYQSAEAGSNPDEFDAVEAVNMEPEERVYDNPDERPAFKPAEQLNKFINDNLTYPQEALELGITGVTHVSFVVDIDGSITNVKILKSSGHAQLDNEAKRVVRKMPRWSPGKMNGIAVRCRATLPIHFEITE